RRQRGLPEVAGDPVGRGVARAHVHQPALVVHLEVLARAAAIPHRGGQLAAALQEATGVHVAVPVELRTGAARTGLTGGEARLTGKVADFTRQAGLPLVGGEVEHARRTLRRAAVV